MTELIAELGINFNGDIEIARQLIDIAISSGCHYVKFQKRDIDLVYTKEELDTPRKSVWGTTTREQKQGLEFGLKEYEAIDKYCKERGIKWFFSVWDINSLIFANLFDSPFIKIPSALITNRGLLDACKRLSDKPIILSTGMSTVDMVDDAIKILGKDRIHCIMHCTSTYPSKPEEMNLKCINTMKERYPWAKIGFSNHNQGLTFMVAAASLGAEMIEFHITLDRAMPGSDQAASIEPEGVHRLCKWIRNLDKAQGDGIKKIYDSELPIIAKLRK